MKRLFLIFPLTLLCACDSYKDKLYNAYYKQCMHEMKNGFYDRFGPFSQDDSIAREYCKKVAFDSVRGFTEEQAKFELKHRDFRPWGQKR